MGNFKKLLPCSKSSMLKTNDLLSLLEIHECSILLVSLFSFTSDSPGQTEGKVNFGHSNERKPGTPLSLCGFWNAEIFCNEKAHTDSGTETLYLI